MFKDTEEALRRFEAELLAQEQEEEQEENPAEETIDDLLSDEELNLLLQDTQVIGSAVRYQNHANGFTQPQKAPHIYNSDNVEQDPEVLSDQLLEEKRSGGTGGLVALACVLTLGIVGILIWWLIRFWGVF